MQTFQSCRKLCESLEELSLLFVVSSHKLFMELLKEEERKVLMEQMRKRSATVNLSAKPLPSFYDIPGGIVSYMFALLHRPRANDPSLLSRMFQSLKAGGDFLGVGSSLHSFSECEHRAARAAANPPAGAAQDQTDPHRAPRHGRTTLLEGQQ